MAEQLNQPLGDAEFTHHWYRRFLQRLLAEGYDFRAFSDRVGDGDVILRHDVDLSVDAAVTMARIEADLGIRSTYCVLLTSPLYNPLEGAHRNALRAIKALGQDVCLHFSTHEYWPANHPPGADAIERRVQEERSVLEGIVPATDTVSFHRPPSWVLNREFDGFRNAYAPAYFDEIGYVADSSQRWREDPPRIESLPETLQLLTHPGLWSETDEGFVNRVEQAITDACRHAGRNTRSEFIDGGESR
ncbi:polysaccharide deacetylase family protein [Halopenitus persicus]|uniref:hypothetical protein n=1 Tax=Halopenitus persicus TaxID=1048396 RepID=UPI000BBB2A8A|nr:hypothetical protein [Halopenitus persicus]